jgi:hypothetical protein
MRKTALAAGLVLYGAGLCVAAFGQAAGPRHEFSPSTGFAHAVPLSSLNKRIEETAAEYGRKYPPGAITRYIEFDIAYPADAAEYAAVGKYAVLLLAACSHDASELPLARVYVRDRALKRIGSAVRAVPAGSQAHKVLGENRVDSFYLVPVDLLRGKDALLADFAKNRTGFVVSSDFDLPPDFILKDAAPKVSSRPSLVAIRTMIDREYPGFGIEFSL